MSTLISKDRISKLCITDEEGNETDFSGEGYLLKRGHGSDVKVVEVILKVSHD